MGFSKSVRYLRRYLGKPRKSTEFTRYIRFLGTWNRIGTEFFWFGIFRFGFRYFSVRFRFSVFCAQAIGDELEGMGKGWAATGFRGTIAMGFKGGADWRRAPREKAGRRRASRARQQQASGDVARSSGLAHTACAPPVARHGHRSGASAAASWLNLATRGGVTGASNGR
jgi:hypothetical protein